jgi:hypothetical protein
VKRLIFAASCGVAAIFPAVSFAQRPTRLHVRQYERAYAHAKRVFGKQTAGCRLLASCRGGVSDARMVASTNVLHRLFARPPAPASAPVAYVTQATSTPVMTSSGGCGGDTPYAGGGQCWAIPYGVVQCESGGQNVPNTQGSGANGYYQLMNGGTGSRAEQDAAASQLWAGGAGASNWTCARP